MYRRPSKDGEDKDRKVLCLNCKAVVPLSNKVCWRCGVTLWNDD